MGRLISYHFDTKNKKFECTWQEDPNINEANRIYIPNGKDLLLNQIILSPQEGGYMIKPVMENSANIIIEIEPSGQVMQRQFTVIFK